MKAPEPKHWWPGTGFPPRYYAYVIRRLRPEKREAALARVPPILLSLVKLHIQIADEREALS